MLRLRNLLGLASLLCLSTTMNAQTTVTTSGGTTSAVPVYTGSSTLGNSPISINDNRVGIGTPAPEAYLNIQPSTDGLTSLLLSQQNCVSCGWSMSAQNDGAFRLFRSDNPSAILSMLYNNGNVGIGTTNPSSHLTVAGAALGSSIGNSTNLLSLQNNNGNTNYLNIFQLRNNSGVPSGSTDNWTSATTRIQNVTDISGQGYIDFNPPAGAWGMAFGTGNVEFMRLVASGNVGIGTTLPGAKLEVNGGIKLTSGTGGYLSFSDNTVQSTAWTGVLSGGDYAESVNVSGNRNTYEPGDVLVIDPDFEGNFLKSSTPYATTVTGIYSTKPGVTGRRQHTSSEHIKEEVPMAMTGIVPTKVSAENGPIKPGDLLVTSSKPGYAMKGTDRSKLTGAVLGKAIGHLDTGTGVIEAVVTLQ